MMTSILFCLNCLLSTSTNHLHISLVSLNYPQKSLTIANVAPVFKKDEEIDPNNYRPISILPAIGNLFEKDLDYQIIFFAS